MFSLQLDITKYKDIPNDSNVQLRIPRSVSFPCKIRRPTKPATSVHRLTPGDIQVVGALGDSLTAATGSKGISVLDFVRENRGISFSAGKLLSIVGKRKGHNMHRKIVFS